MENDNQTVDAKIEVMEEFKQAIEKIIEEEKLYDWKLGVAWIDTSQVNCYGVGICYIAYTKELICCLVYRLNYLQSELSSMSVWGLQGLHQQNYPLWV